MYLAANIVVRKQDSVLANMLFVPAFIKIDTGKFKSIFVNENNIDVSITFIAMQNDF